MTEARSVSVKRGSHVVPMHARPVEPALLAPGERYSSLVAGLDDTCSLTEHDG